MKKVLFIIASLLLSCMLSCNKDKGLLSGIVKEPHPRDTIPDNPDKHIKVRQSIKIHDDNVNGVFLRKVNTIQEAVYYFYNENDYLDSLVVFADTTKSKLIKSMKLHYVPSENKIRANFYEWQVGYYTMDFHYDNHNKILKISTESLGKEYGIFYIYDQDTLKHIKMEYSKVSISTNMKYDQYSNLKEYEIYNTSEPYIRAQFEYDYSFPVDKTFDIRFASIEIKFLYEGGVNVAHLMGLNYGLGNSHIVKGRYETRLEDSTIVRNQYEFEYTKDSFDRLVGRKIKFNNRAEAIFKYEY